MSWGFLVTLSGREEMPDQVGHDGQGWLTVWAGMRVWDGRDGAGMAGAL